MSKNSLWQKVAGCLTVAGSLAFSHGASAAEVALFFNDQYVDTAPDDCGSEANNLIVSIESFGGNTVTTFTGITAADFSAAVEDRNPLVIPEFNAGLNLDLDDAARQAIADFVDQGGRLILFGEDSAALIDFFDDVFGITVNVSSSPDTSTKTAEAAGTIFADGPASIPYNDGTAYIQDSSLPAEAINVYSYNNGSEDFAVVAIFPFGSGDIIFLGWDWYSSGPGAGDNTECEGPQDGGWQDLLATAVETVPVPTPTPTPSPTATPTPTPTPTPPIQIGGGGCSLQVGR
ncbi:MAG TPA: hypothetical protein VFW62_12175 [bacterium]|nr:hypothetical protein [bacterium]